MLATNSATFELHFTILCVPMGINLGGLKMTDAETQAIARHYEKQFTEGWGNAFKDYASEYPTTRHIHSPRSRASILHDHCVHHIQAIFADNPDVGFPPKKRGLFTVELSGKPIGIDGKVLARLKKLNESFLTSNISTAQVRAFNDQQSMEIQGELFGFPLIEVEPPHVNIGYMPDKFWMSARGVYATMPNGSHALHWYMKFTDGRDDEQNPIIDIPIQPVQPQVRRVVAKRSRDQKKQSEKG